MKEILKAMMTEILETVVVAEGWQQEKKNLMHYVQVKKKGKDWVRWEIHQSEDVGLDWVRDLEMIESRRIGEFRSIEGN